MRFLPLPAKDMDFVASERRSLLLSPFLSFTQVDQHGHEADAKLEKEKAKH